MTATEIDKDLVDVIQMSANYPSILRMGVFGSYARGDQTSESDIDIIYDYDETQVDDMLDCLDAILNEIEKKNKKVDFYAYYLLFKDDMTRSGAKFRDNVLQEIVWIYDRKEIA